MMVYLDHNATTPPDERVVEAMLPYLRGEFGNPSSSYLLGRRAREAMEQARAQVAALVGAHPSQVIFTAGGSEANNTAIKGIALGRPPGRMVVGSIEHASVLEPSRALTALGWHHAILPVDPEGRYRLDALGPLLDEGCQLLSAMWVNNETGGVQEVARMAELCRERGVAYHCDAVQALGKVAIDFGRSGVDLLSLSAHKIYGPKGVGALVVNKGITLQPLIHGGGQEHGARGGTENLAAIVGFGQAAELAAGELEGRNQKIETLCRTLELGLRQQLPEVRFFAAGAQRVANTLFFAIPRIEGQTLIMALDRLGIAVSSGSACGSEQKEPSHVLAAMGVAPELARGAVRISLGAGNSQEDIAAVLQAVKEQVNRLQQMAAATAW